MAHRVTAPAMQRARRLLDQRVQPCVTHSSLSFEVFASEELFETVSYEKAIALSLSPFAIGTRWGKAWHTVWFKLVATVPANLAGQPLVAAIDLGFNGRGDGFQVEGLAYRHGKIVQAVQPDRRLVHLGSSAVGEVIELWVEAAATPIIAGHAFGYGPTPLGDPATSGNAPLYQLRRAELAVFDQGVHDLAVALHTAIDLTIDLEESSSQRARMFAALERAGNALNVNAVSETASLALAELKAVLISESRGTSHYIVAAGHAHLDTAWLWPIRETRRKAVRTFANAVDLLKKNPDAIFSHSQAQHYAWVREEAPEIFAEVVELVKAGQWEPVGGMWVETDLNLPVGESLLRQMVHGQRAFDSWFGTRCDGAFLPDDFGYPGTLPQIVQHGGGRWFFTQKLSWNETNKFPHHTFWWEGIDGTRVFTHFSPVDTYNALLTPSQLRFAEKNFADHVGATRSLVLYGHGDGGGGPTQTMIDRGRWANNLEGVPQVSFGTIRKFFADAENEYGDQAQTWVGEMYFEKHRGTYSSQLGTKQGNRNSERLLHELEIWSAAVGQHVDDIDGLWKRVLTQQFHDIIPGSSIAWVHDDAEAEHAAVASEIVQHLDAVLSPRTDGSTWLLNPAPVAISGVVDIDGHSQWVEVPATSGTQNFSSDLPVQVSPVLCDQTNDQLAVTNGRIRICWNQLGEMVQLLDCQTGRSLMGDNRVSSFVLRQDTPAEYDAWDIDVADANSPAIPVKNVGAPRIESQSDLRVVVVADFATTHSKFRVRWSLTAGSSRLDIALDADWNESEYRLQMNLPTNVLAREATCGTQFGHVRRPRHHNTSWDVAKFEVCAHRYVHVGEPGCGIAILADGPRGYDIRGNALALTLLRSPKFPDPQADMGRQRVEWSLYVDQCPGDVEGIEIESALVAHPYRLITGTPIAISAGIRLDARGALISVIKPADDGSGDLVVRLWETRGASTSGTLSISRPAATAVLCNALEEPLSSEIISVKDGIVDIELAPFQIQTLRISA
jgi:alpha-mannosidase